MLITVIVAVYNGEKTLGQCIESIKKQNYENKELIIIDGGSTDKTKYIIEKNEKYIKYWESKPDKGIYHAWNKGLKHANGDWVCFLGADDYFWGNDALEKLSIILKSVRIGIRIVYGQVAILDQKGKFLYYIGKPWDRIKKTFKQQMCIPHPGTMHHRTVFEDHGYFDESYKISGDYELLLRELKNREAYCAPLTVVGMRTGGISSTPANTMWALREMRLARQKNAVTAFAPLWWISYLKVLLRLALWKTAGEKMSRKLLDIARLISGQKRFWTRT